MRNLTHYSFSYDSREIVFSLDIEISEQENRASIMMTTSLDAERQIVNINADFSNKTLAVSDLNLTMSATSCLISCGLSTAIPSVLDCWRSTGSVTEFADCLANKGASIGTAAVGCIAGCIAGTG